MEAVGERIVEVTDLCCQRLEQIGATFFSRREDVAHRSGIVTFELPGCNSLALRKHCYTRQVAIAQRAGKLRISPHAYNDESDVDRLIEALEAGRKICEAK